MTAGATDIVILRGLAFDGGSVNRAGGATTAVAFTSGAKLHVDNCTFFGFAGEAIAFQPSGASSLFVNNTSFRSNNGSVQITPASTGTANASLNGVKFENGYRGVRADDGATVVVRNSIAAGNNPGNGFTALSTGARPAILTIENSTASSNASYGVLSSGSGAVVRINNVTSIDNGLSGVGTLNGGVVYSTGANRFLGNVQGDVAAGTVLTPWTQQ